MAIKWKNNSFKGIFIILICAALASTVMCNMYPYFRGNAQNWIAKNQESGNTLEGTADVAVPEEADTFTVDEEFERYLASAIFYLNYEATPDMDAFEYLTQNYDTSRLTQAELEAAREVAAALMKSMRSQWVTEQDINSYSSYVVGTDREFGTDSILGQIIYGNYLDPEDYYDVGLILRYDSRGVLSVKETWNMDVDEGELVRYLNSATMSRLMDENGIDYTALWDDAVYTEPEVTEDYAENEEGVEVTTEAVYESEETISYRYTEGAEILKSLPVPQIKNTSFAFGVSLRNDSYDYENNWMSDYWMEREAFERSGFAIGMFGLAALMTVLALILQNIPALGLRKNRLFCWPTELVALGGFFGILATAGVVYYGGLGYYMAGDELRSDLAYMGFGSAAESAAVALVWIFWFLYCLCYYWLAASVLPYLAHPIRSLRERLLCLSVCRWIKKQCQRIWHWGTDLELNTDLTSKIWKVVAVNGLIVALLCCIWFGGIFGAVIYSILVYVLVRRKCGEIIEDYKKILHITRRMAEGDLNVQTEEETGLFNPLRDELGKIRDGFQKAIQEEMKSRNMRTELITNVSHDLKTPLTAIITYVDLLKKEDLTEEERREYIATLDKKSQRLKVLIEDLFEVSKATTSNITMNYEEVDLVSLIKEVKVENEDKISGSTLDIRWNLPEEKCILSLDPQRTYRIIDNLLQNILKYSMPHSRVYIELKNQEQEVTVTMKNMSATEMNFSAEEITQRFVRGDLSRSTEGSGLGLAIAQSFTELQGGTFRVEIDGDLFKVILGFKRG